jgi:hypothetical protein
MTLPLQYLTQAEYIAFGIEEISLPGRIVNHSPVSREASSGSGYWCYY